MLIPPPIPADLPLMPAALSRAGRAAAAPTRTGWAAEAPPRADVVAAQANPSIRTIPSTPPGGFSNHLRNATAVTMPPREMASIDESAMTPSTSPTADASVALDSSEPSIETTVEACIELIAEVLSPDWTIVVPNPPLDDAPDVAPSVPPPQSVADPPDATARDVPPTSDPAIHLSQPVTRTRRVDLLARTNVSPPVAPTEFQPAPHRIVDSRTPFDPPPAVPVERPTLREVPSGVASVIRTTPAAPQSNQVIAPFEHIAPPIDSGRPIPIVRAHRRLTVELPPARATPAPDAATSQLPSPPPSPSHSAGALEVESILARATPQQSHTTPAVARASAVNVAVELANVTSTSNEIDLPRAISLPVTPSIPPEPLIGATSASGESTPLPQQSSVEQAETFDPRFVRAMHAMLNHRGGVMTMRLDPPELGSVRVHMSVHQGTVTASMDVTTADAFTALRENLGTLRASLEGQGLSIERLSVHIAPQTSNPDSARSDDDPRNPHRSAHHDPPQGESRGRFDDRRSHHQRNLAPIDDLIPFDPASFDSTLSQHA